MVSPVARQLDSEYESLRDEMAQRHGHVHQTLVFAVGATFAAIAWGLTETPTPDLGTFRLQLSTVLSAIQWLLWIYLADQYRVLYAVGTYIAFEFETNNLGGPRWQRMSRSFSEWGKSTDGCHRWLSSLPFPVGRRWGTGPQTAAYVILGNALSVAVALVVPNIQFSASLELLPTAAGFLCVSLMWPAYDLGIRMKTYRERLESEWRNYHVGFSTSSVAKVYDAKNRRENSASDRPEGESHPK